jgi:hypothetical protein
MDTWATGVTQDRRAQKTWLPSNLLRNSAACNWSPGRAYEAVPPKRRSGLERESTGVLDGGTSSLGVSPLNAVGCT